LSSKGSGLVLGRVIPDVFARSVSDEAVSFSSPFRERMTERGLGMTGRVVAGICE